MERIITIFGSNQPIEGTSDYAVAYELGKRLAERGFTICNGGYGGTMEAAARGGTGTLVELALSWEYINKGLSPPKPIVLLGDFWNSVVDTVLKEIGPTQAAGGGQPAPMLPQFIYKAQTPQDAVSILTSLLPPS